jgi:hypothetical protein
MSFEVGVVVGVDEFVVPSDPAESRALTPTAPAVNAPLGFDERGSWAGPWPEKPRGLCGGPYRCVFDVGDAWVSFDSRFGGCSLMTTSMRHQP